MNVADDSSVTSIANMSSKFKVCHQHPVPVDIQQFHKIIPTWLKVTASDLIDTVECGCPRNVVC